MSCNSEPPLRLCLAGIGGYALNHHKMVTELEKQGKVRLMATCDPRHEQLGEAIDGFSFRRRSVEVLASFDEMMARFARQSQFVSIATPIHSHAAMHEAVASRNLGCYLEKPPTLDPSELESMIAAERSSDFMTEVGFNYLAEEWRRNLKQRLLDGEWGELRSLSLFGAWDRPASYYQRTNWAGRLLIKDRLVLDSSFGNAVSHNVHNILFFAGREGLLSWAEPLEVDCELYRAYPIEGADTVFSEMTTKDGIKLRVALSHACQPGRNLLEVIVCERAEIRIKPYESYEIVHRSGRREFVQTDSNARLLWGNFAHYLAYLKGKEERPLTGLADCRPFVWWNALNYLASRQINSIPLESCGVDSESGSISITGVEEVMAEFIRTGVFPSGQRLPWGRCGGSAHLGDLPDLFSCIKGIAYQGEVPA